jgi:hypothetical protein
MWGLMKTSKVLPFLVMEVVCEVSPGRHREGRLQELPPLGQPHCPLAGPEQLVCSKSSPYLLGIRSHPGFCPSQGWSEVSSGFQSLRGTKYPPRCHS